MISIDIIPSKSYAHRALICAGLEQIQQGSPRCRVVCDLPSKDIEATRRCVEALIAGDPVMACGESGSTLRFLLPVLGALGKEGIFQTEGRLGERPLSPLKEELEAHGCKVGTGSTVTISGQLTPGTFTIPGNISSQFITGLLLALPLLDGDSRIQVTGTLESAAYVDITREVLAQFGIPVTHKASDTGCGMVFEVSGRQAFRGPETLVPEGDWSAAAFWIAAGILGKEPVEIRGLNLASRQGDREIVSIARQFGAQIQTRRTDVCGSGNSTGCPENEESLIITPSETKGITVDVSGIPDLAPVIALIGARSSGTTRITGAARLRIKESDRLSAIAAVLTGLGVSVLEEEAGLVIEGTCGKPFAGGELDGWNDHRIVMMEAIASIVSCEPVTICGKEAVSKSWPGFFRVLENAGLGGNVR